MNTAVSVRTVSSIRSTKGCWVCRLRKKKCDETRPGCARCDSVNIKCCYGPKPKWIQDTALGKGELERVKILVAATATRKRIAFRAKIRSGSTVDAVSQSPLEESSTSANTAPRSKPMKASDPPASSIVVGATGVQEAQSALFSKWIGDQEANLIMHYLDYVFYIQFRFHTPAISEGGRGWLLSLLTRTKPLYHAALSLSAFHQQSLMLQEQGGAEKDYLHELERQYNLTLKELQLFIQAHSLTESTERAFDRNVQILACVVQLISFELFNGGVSNWQVHLRAASDLVLILHEIPPPNTVSPQDSLKQRASAKSPESFALKFFTGCILWFDILSCISTGSPSFLGKYHDRFLLSPASEGGPYIELHTIAGCHNWAMAIISEIATLSAKRNESPHAANFHSPEFNNIVQDIHFRLESHRDACWRELEAVRQQYHRSLPFSSPKIYNKYTVLVITNIFASAAIIYLHTVNSPEPSPTHIQPALQTTVRAIRMVPDPRMVRGLVWPLCVAGCMAACHSDQEFFRTAATGAVNDSRSFGNSGQALEILEMSWRLQQERGRLVDCASTIQELGTCILLV